MSQYYDNNKKNMIITTIGDAIRRRALCMPVGKRPVWAAESFKHSEKSETKYCPSCSTHVPG